MISCFGICRVSMVEIRLIQTRFKLIGKASAMILLYIALDMRILYLLEGLKARKMHENMADENSPASIPMHTKEMETFAPSFKES